MSIQKKASLSKLLYWAYIHSVSEQIKLKRWTSGPRGALCDLEYCKKYEMGKGSFVLAVTPKPFSADNQDEAMLKAEAIFRKQGFNNDEHYTITRPTTAENRFYHLELD